MQELDHIEVAGACKEESSDESTIISSQTSTLTRSQGNFFLLSYHSSDLVYNSLILGQDEMQFDIGLQEPITIKTDDEDEEDVNEDSSEDEDRRSKFFNNCFFKIIFINFY